MGLKLPEAQRSSYSGTSKYQFLTDVQLEHLFVSSLPIKMFILLIVGKTWNTTVFFIHPIIPLYYFIHVATVFLFLF